MCKLNAHLQGGSIIALASTLTFTVLLTTVPSGFLCAQMESTVNSLADDIYAYPYDDPETPEDESTDGVCGDEQGRCTLRAALDEAALIGTSARVVFSVSGNIVLDPLLGPFYPPDDSRIQGYDQNVSIIGDGMNTPAIFGIGNNTLVTGIQLINALNGIEVIGANNRIGYDSPELANYIDDMEQNGILVTGDSNTITGNVIGIDLLGFPNGSPSGIFVFGKGNVIGGINAGEGNTISGNDKGVAIYTVDSGAYNYVIGNSIGTDLTGTQAMGNRVGIEIIGPNVIVGGDSLIYGNVISGNTESGILLGLDAADIRIANNLIGVDQTGTIAIPNRDGITLGPGSDSCFVWRNVIKENTQTGILISGIPGPDLAAQNHTILGNIIAENDSTGIVVSGSANNNVIGGSATHHASTPNQIHHNGRAGVIIGGGLGIPQRNAIRENQIWDNTIYGIRILSGQEGIQPPTLESYSDDGQGMSTVVGMHPAVGGTVDVYAGAPNQANRLEGPEWLGYGQVYPNGHFTIMIPSCSCDSIVATATDKMGNTSEFSSGWALTTTAVHDLVGNSDMIRATPNPFRRATTLRFELSEPEVVVLQIYNLSGQLVRTLVEENLPAGMHSVDWEPDNEPSGMYYYKLFDPSHAAVTGKVCYIK